MIVFKKWGSLPLAFLVVVFSGSLRAEVVTFGDGVTLEIPAGWNPQTLVTDAPPAPSQPDSANAISLLLWATALDGRHATVSLVRNSTPDPPDTGRSGALARHLAEMAAAQGGKVSGTTERSLGDASETIHFAEVTASSSEGGIVWSCVEMNRAPGPSWRLYMQRAADDEIAEKEFTVLIASLVFGATQVSTALDAQPASTSVASQETPLPQAPAVENVMATVSPAAPSTAGDSSTVRRAAELIAKSRDSLVLVEGEAGVGSGFICAMDGKRWLLTNIHVLAENSEPRFTTLDRQALQPGAARLAVNHDICIIGMPDDGGGLTKMEKVDTQVRIGDEVLVPGNSGGAGVITPLTGRIVGIGPNLIEIDAPLIEGNSGSPIIHLESGTVIGVATYLIVRKVDDDSKGRIKTETRRFAYRLDSVKKWEPLIWQKFQAQAAQVRELEKASLDFLQLFEDSRERRITSGNYRYRELQRAIETFERRLGLTGNSISAADWDIARRRLLADLRTATHADISRFNSRTAYDYFRRIVEREQKFREELYAEFSRALNASRN